MTMRLLLLAVVLLVHATNGVAGESSNLPRQVLEEMNRARVNPQGYVKVLQEYRDRFRGSSYQTAPHTFVETQEGTVAVDEAIGALKEMKPLPPLSWSGGLAAAAAELAQEQAGTGQTGHQGRRSGSMRERIERHGGWRGQIGENIGYGPSEARLMVISLIVDDGVPDRGHRDNIFSRTYREAGVACGRHPRFRNLCVIDFATSFSTRGGKR